MREKTVLGMVLMASLATGRVSAESSGAVDLGASNLDGNVTNAKFLEYRDRPTGLSSTAWFTQNSDKWYVDVRAENLNQADESLTVTLRKVGLLRVEGSYDLIPHRFASGARTPYQGVGSGNLTLPNGMQKDLQASNSTTDMANTLQGDYAPSFQSVDLGLRREQGHLTVDARLFKGFKANLTTSHERRTGTRSIGAASSTANFMELPEPINYDTTELSGQLEYSRGKALVQAGGAVSNFENRVDAMVWDNPFRSTDASPAAGTAAYQLGGATGAIDLYPDNIEYNGTALGRVELPRRSRLLVSANWGRRFQDDPLLAYTTNTAVIPGAKNSPPFNASKRSNLPEENVNGRVDTTLYNAQLTSNPIKDLRIRAGLRYQGFTNKFSPMEFPGVVLLDQNWVAGPVETETAGYLKRKFSAGASYNLPLDTAFNLDYAHEIFDRTGMREVARSLEDSYKLSLNTAPVGWLELRPSFERSRRKADVYNPSAPFDGALVIGQLPWLRKYDEASRDRRRVGLLATVEPWDDLSLTASYLWGQDEFDESLFGLLDDRHKVASVEGSYDLGKRLSVYGSFTREIYASNARSRQWTPGGNGDPFGANPGTDSDSNWTEFDDDRVDTSELGLEMPALVKKVDLRGSYTESHSDGKIVRESPVGGPTDANNFEPVPYETVDETTQRTVQVSANRGFGDRVSIQAGFSWDWYKYQDYNQVGYSDVPTTLAGAYKGGLFMGTLPSHYVVNMGFIRMNLRF